MRTPEQRLWITQLPSRSLSKRTRLNEAFATVGEFTVDTEVLPSPFDLLISVDSSPRRNISALGRFHSYTPSVRGRSAEVNFEYSPVLLRKPIAFSALASTSAFRGASFQQGFSRGELYLLTERQRDVVMESLAKDASAAALLRRTGLNGLRGKQASPHEGHRKWSTHLRIERARGLPARKKLDVYSHTGSLKCEVCDFDFAKFYDIPGLEFLCEAHHLEPLASLKKAKITYMRDLALICANCHSVLHHLDPMPSVRDLRKFVRQGFINRKGRGD